MVLFSQEFSTLWPSHDDLEPVLRLINDDIAIAERRSRLCLIGVRRGIGITNKYYESRLTSRSQINRGVDLISNQVRPILYSGQKVWFRRPCEGPLKREPCAQKRLSLAPFHTKFLDHRILWQIRAVGDDRHARTMQLLLR